MIHITDDAKSALRNGLTGADTESGTAFRFVDQGDGRVGVEKGAREPGDVEMEHEGTVILYVPEELTSSLMNVTIDVTNSIDTGTLQLVVRADTDE